MAGARVIKADGDGATIPVSRRMPEDPWLGVSADHILRPPYDPGELFAALETSEVLRQCIDAMATNIDGFGFQLDPVGHIAELINSGKDVPKEAQDEKKAIERFFNYCHPEDTFSSIRQKTRKDYEAVGYAFWEILRNGKGEVVGIEHIPAVNMRLCKLDPDPIQIEVSILDTARNEYERIPYRKRFRRFAQVVNGKVVYFKEFGDPRRMNALDGKYLGEGERPSGRFVEATEILYFSQYHPGTAYGVPRWVGQLLAIAGSRAAAEVNWSYFDNKAVPPLIISVSGGRLSDRTVKRIARFLEEAKGRENFHAALVLEADTPGGALGPSDSKAKIEVKDLGGSILKDGLFMEYDKANREKIRSAFRLPPIFIGQTEDYTRATSEESHNVAELQVFGPERDAFDDIINRRLFPALGFRFWKFRSLAAKQEDPERLSEILERLAKVGLTVREARAVIAEILNVNLVDPTYEDGTHPEWLDYPLPVFQVLIQAGLIDLSDQISQTSHLEDGDDDKGGDLEEVAKSLIRIRKMLERARTA